jgi:ABC-type glycerol-3-phosphate transport system substrate-binding protein
MKQKRSPLVSVPTAVAAAAAIALVPAPAAGAATGVTISFMEAMSSGTQKTALATLTSEFEKADPGVTVQLVSEPDYGTLLEKEEAAVAAGNPPTMGQAYENWAATFAGSGAIVPLATYINGKDGVSSAQQKQFWASVWDDLYLPDGKIWMWPFNKSDYVVYYNATMLKKDGLSVPATWAQWAADGPKITHGPYWEESMATGTLSAPENGTYLYLSMVRAYGGSWTKGAKPTLDTKAAVTALSVLQGMVKKGYMKIGTNYPGQTALGAGRSAFDISTVAGYPYVLDAVGKKFNMQVAAMPSGPAGEANALEGTNLVIFSKATAAQKQAAWAFMKWLTEPKQTAYWAEQTGYLPVTRAALPLMTAYDATHPYQEIAAKELQYATPSPAYSWWTEAVGEVGVALEAALVNNQSPAAALASAQRKAMAAAG